jgi:phosphate transport system protein
VVPTPESLRMLLEMPTLYDPSKRDDVVDNMRDDVYREEIKRMSENSEYVKSSLQVIKISHNLERIADLTTNFCEDIIYYISGEMIKHNLEE